MVDSDRALVLEGLRASRSSPRAAILVGSSIAVLGALFLVSWLIFMPVGALMVAPITLVGRTALSVEMYVNLRAPQDSEACAT